MYDTLGDAPRAREYYQQFVKLWEGADPELRYHAVEARSRLEELGAGVP